MAVTRQLFKNLAQKFVDDTFADFTHTFTIESLTETPDGQGGFNTGWVTFATVTGFVKPVKLEKKLQDDHIKSKVVKQFSFEYVAGLTNDMRIVYDGDNYKIMPFDPIQDVDVWIDVMAEQDVAT